MELMTEEFIQTELGSIPDDWKLCRFEDVMDGFSSGQTPYREIKRYYTGNIPWITSGELNYNVITDTIEKITPEAVQKTTLKIIPKGTFLMAITGLEAAGTRGSCAITGVDATTNQSCMALYPKPGLLITEYLFHFYVRYGDFLAFKYCQGTKQQSYTGAIAKTLPIILPPTIEEQTAIATALSDADALITALEKLIAKKRAIKQGVMQKLLQPKEGWEIVPLGNRVRLQGGYAFKSEAFSDQGVPVIRISDVLNDEVSIAACVYHPEINIPKEFHVSRNDVLIAMSGATTGKIGVYGFNMNAYLNQRVGKFVIKDVSETSVEYVSQIVRSELFRESLVKELAQGAQPNVSGKQIESLELPFPVDIKEQNRIAEIVNTLDLEIGLLEKKLSKQRQLKQGMMQNLLTGKIRLV